MTSSSEDPRDIYHAEKQIVKALPKLARATKPETPRKAVERHVEETPDHPELDRPRLRDRDGRR